MLPADVVTADAFQVGWICALPKEAAAANLMLDVVLECDLDQDPADSNAYSFGRIGKHNVVIACLPTGRYGTNSAAVVANNMQRSFPGSLRIGVLVGIGGAIPRPDDPEADVRLGDVVISVPTDLCGGVIQYDLGKAKADGTFTRQGSLNSPPDALLSALALLRGKALYDLPKYPDYLQQAIEKNALTKRNFVRPTSSLDRLFQADRMHPGTATTCSDCSSEWEIMRSARAEAESQAYYGIIASVNQLVKDAAVRDKLGRETNALCVEMEAAGLMQGFPCIVIRGICDYCDSHKNDVWQNYAALAAAAFTKDLLSFVSPVRISQEQLLVDVCDFLGALSDRLASLQIVQSKAMEQADLNQAVLLDDMRTQDERRVLAALSTSDYEALKDINPLRIPGTCRWVLDNPRYQAWLNNEQDSFLWISADPGCGKSVLARSLIDQDLKQIKGSPCIAYFFFKDNPIQNRLEVALAAVLHQIFIGNPHLATHALKALHEHGELFAQQSQRLWNMLLAASADEAAGPITCIFDGLDECQERDQVQLVEYLSGLRARSRGTEGTLKFLITSRLHSQFNHDLHQSMSRTLQEIEGIHLHGEEEGAQIEKEIDLVIHHRMDQLTQSRHLSADLKARLTDELLNIEHRTYLWLTLAMEQINIDLRDHLRPEKSVVKLVPLTVHAAYQQILDRVPPNQQRVVRETFQIIVGARRPLSVDELLTILGIATSPDAKTLGESRISMADPWNALRRMCGLFIFESNTKVYLLHQTAKAFLLGEGEHTDEGSLWTFDRSAAEILLAAACVRRLLMVRHQADTVNSDPAPDILDYASQNWADHYQSEPALPSVAAMEVFEQLCDVSEPLFWIWFRSFCRVRLPAPRQLIPKITRTHILALNGHSTMLKWQLDLDTSLINERDSTGRTAVSWAAEMGHLEAVSLLLETKACAGLRCGRHRNALNVASRGGHLEIVQLLLDRASVDDQEPIDLDYALSDAAENGHEHVVRTLLKYCDTTMDLPTLFGNALHKAVGSGSESLVSLLLREGADVDHAGGTFGSPLGAALSHRHTHLVSLLLEQGANVNATPGAYGTPLRIAVGRLDLPMVELFLQRGADVNTSGGYWENSLQSVLRNDASPDLVDLLIHHGADIHARSREFGNALQAAAFAGNDHMVQRLYDAGCDIQETYGHWGTPLTTAASRGHESTVELLLRLGAEVNSKSGQFGSALAGAAWADRTRIVQLLLDAGADINGSTAERGSAVQIAAHGGYDQMIRFLVRHGADLHCGSRQENALLDAITSEHLSSVETLLDCGMDVNFQSDGSDTGVQRAALYGQGDVVRLLCDHGADINAGGELYCSALQAACHAGHEDVVKDLLSRGADVHLGGGLSGCALQAAAAEGYSKIVKLLIDSGADVNQMGGEFGTPLQAACLDGAESEERSVSRMGLHVAIQGARTKGLHNSFNAAAEKGYQMSAFLLLERGAKVSLTGGKYGSAVQAAAYAGNDLVLSALHRAGADVNATGGKFQDALEAAAYRGHAKTVDWLLSSGAWPHLLGTVAGNPMLAALCSRNDAVVQVLMRRSANFDGRLLFRGAVEAAIYHGHRKLERLLREHEDIAIGDQSVESCCGYCQRKAGWIADEDPFWSWRGAKHSSSQSSLDDALQTPNGDQD